MTGYFHLYMECGCIGLVTDPDPDTFVPPTLAYCSGRGHLTWGQQVLVTASRQVEKPKP